MSEKKTVVINKFAVVEKEKQKVTFENGTLYAYAARNCKALSDVLECCVGLQPFYWEEEEVPLGEHFAAVRFFFSLQNKNEDGSLRRVLGFVTRKGGLFVYDKQTKTWVKKHDFECVTVCQTAMQENEKQVLALGNAQGLFIFDDELGVRKVEKVEKVRSIAYFKGRIFCVNEHFQLFYSAPFNADDFSESIDDGGSILLPMDRGICQEIRVVNGELFLFFERGIFSVTGVGSARDFTAKEVAFCEGRIVWGSFANLCTPQEKAFFLTEDGAFTFDGKTVQRVGENWLIDPRQGAQVFAHGQFDGYYYLCYQSKDGVKEVAIDGKNGLAFESFYVTTVGDLGGELICVENGILKRVRSTGDLPTGEYVRFYLQDVNFGVFGRKTWKSIRFFGSGKAAFSMNYKGKLCTWQLDLSNEKSEARLDWIGENFTFWIMLNAGAHITRMEVELQIPSSKTKGGCV